MRKAIAVISAIVVVLCFLIIRDYNNYFYGRSLINYHILPYELTPDYYKHYEIEEDKKVSVENFSFITNCSEFVGPPNSIPMNSPSTFTIDTIKCYYYNDDSIFVLCVDTENKMHWIKPNREKDGCVVFNEIKNLRMNDLSKYKRVSGFYDGK